MISIVLGSFFGDEGKGQTVHELCEKAINPTVVRFSGGHQVGHTVIYNGKSHVFSNFGSGTLLGVPTYWSEFCTVDPAACALEERIIYEKFGVSPTILYSPFCQVITPYDILFQRQNIVNREHGTVGVGFAACLMRVRDGYSLTAIDCCNINVLYNKMQSIVDNYYLPILGQTEGLINSGAIKSWVAETYSYFHKKRFAAFEDLFNSTVRKDIIFEGSQGILLDQKFGIMPYCTPSNTTSQNAMELIRRLKGSRVPEVYYVCRPYITRHGNGPTVTWSPISHYENPYETNVGNDFQGGFRQVEFDVHLLEHSIKLDSLFSKDSLKTVVLRQCNIARSEVVNQIKELVGQYDRLSLKQVDFN